MYNTFDTATETNITYVSVNLNLFDQNIDVGSHVKTVTIFTCVKTTYQFELGENSAIISSCVI